MRRGYVPPDTDLRTLAIDIGLTTPFSVSDAEYAINRLARAGLDVSEIRGAMPVVLGMAHRWPTSLPNAANIVAKAIGTDA
jgi:TP901 family phage tail tape measure protein